LALGGNQGSPDTVEATLRWALRRLEAALGPLHPSSLYRTKAHVRAPSREASPLPQPDYLNAAAAGWTGLPADAVLAIAKRLELHAGRTLGERDAPRPLDLDLLLYGDAVSDRPELTLPHPRLAARRFVLAPLAEVAPDRPVPPHGRSVRELLAGVEDQEGVERIGWSGPPPLSP